MSAGMAVPLLAQGIGSHALQHNGLASHAQEWQRELDRAQARAWFHAAAPAVPAGRGGAGSDAVVLSGPAPAIPCGAPPPLDACTPGSAPHPQEIATPAGAPPHVEGEALRARVDAAAGARAAAAPVSSHGRMATPDSENPLPCAARKVAPPPSSAPDGAALRLHVEAGAEGVRVWLGLDGDAALIAARAAALLPQLRRALEAEGHRLLAFTCNGRLLDEAAPSSQRTEQSTWPSERSTQPDKQRAPRLRSDCRTS